MIREDQLIQFTHLIKVNEGNVEKLPENQSSVNC